MVTELHGFPVVAAILALAVAAALAATLLRQPLVVAFIGVGIAVGPVGLGWVRSDGTVELLAGLGIAILLFLVGLRLDLNLIRSTGPVALATGLGQITLTAAAGYALALGLGLDPVPALYVAVALTFSSTIIVVKMLSDKRELEHLHGRIAVGLLIVQDIAVLLVMIALTAFGQHHDGAVAANVAAVAGKGLGLLAAITVLMRYVLPRTLHAVARSQELLVLFGVAYAASVASLSEWLGFSAEVGAFLAGVSLASTPYRDALGARLVSMRDFLLLFFFIDLGSKLDFSDAARQLAAAAVLSLFVLLAKPLVVLVLMALLRYPVRVGFLAGLTVAQISEFSLILAALGLGLGHITNATVSLVTVVGLVTIAGSTYLIQYNHQLYRALHRVLARLDRSHAREVDLADRDDTEVVLFGLGRFGSHIADRLGRAGYRVLAVDFDPHRVSTNTRLGVTAVFGSAEDVHFLETLPLAGASYVISTVPVVETNLALLHGLRHHRFRGRVALTAHTVRDAATLASAGPDLVLEPFAFAAEACQDALREMLRRPAGEQEGAAG